MIYIYIYIETEREREREREMIILGDALSVAVFVVGNRISDLSSNPGQRCLHFTLC